MADPVTTAGVAGSAVGAVISATPPVPPVPPMPAGTTLKDLITPTGPADASGNFHLGTLELDKNQLKAFQKAQTDLVPKGQAPNPEQLATLWAVEHGHLPESEPVAKAPAGTTIDGLLKPASATPDAQGYVHLGKLAVKPADLPQFEALQRNLASKNPEALDVLNKLENGTRDYKLNLNNVGNNTFDPGTNTISWDPRKDLRDQYNKSNVPAKAAGYHEEGHATGTPIVSATLHGIPDKMYSNYEEKRVIEGPEAREMKILGLPPRHSHIGVAYPVNSIDSIKPELTVTQNGKDRSVGAPFQQSGKILGADADHVTIDVGHGQQMQLKTNELVGFMGSSANVQAVLNDAKAHGDTTTFSISNDGKVSYQDPAQLQRFFQTPNPPYQLLAAPAANELPQQHDAAHVGGAGR